MAFVYTYIALLSISFILFLVLYFYMFRNKNSLAINFSVYCLFNALYIFAILGILFSANDQQALFFYRLKALGSLFIPPLFVLFLYNFHSFFDNAKRHPMYLFVIPLITLLIISTNEYHHLYYSSLAAFKEGRFFFIDKTAGPLYWLQGGYGAIMLLFSLYYLHKLSLRKNKSFRKFSLFLFIYLIFSLLLSVLYFTNLVPYNLDVLPIANLFGVIIYMLGIFYCDIFDVYELNNSLMPELTEGVIISDINDQIIYYNAVAEKHFPWLDERFLGVKIEHLPLKVYPTKTPENSTVYEHTFNGTTNYFLFKNVPLEHKHNIAGNAYVFRDHTEHFFLHKRLEYLATRDGLTNIYNQITILNVAEDKFNSAKENKTVFSITIMDIDNFKTINDKYGHIFGNSVLIEIANSISDHFKDTCCSFGRFGGDEFLIACDDCDVNMHEETLNKLLEFISTIEYTNNKIVNLSLSAGSEYVDFSKDVKDLTYTEVLEKADKKMYKAKEQKKQ